MGVYGYVGDDEDDFDGGDARPEMGHQQWEVELCSGDNLVVQTKVEQRWFNATKDKYLSENKFTAVTDEQDLDRLLAMELLVFRWTQHLASGYDYEKNIVDDDLLRKQLKEQSDVILKLKQSLGLDKKARDAALNEGNFHTWFEDVKRRAQLFGVHRENQLNVALALINELSGNLGAFDRSDTEERKKLGWADETALIAWVREDMLPRFRVVDEHFLQNEQRMWKRDM